MEKKLYLETFDNGAGGWYALDRDKGAYELLIKNGVVRCDGPWWIDYNHAPPGAGYINLLMGLYIKGPVCESIRDIGGPNHFIEGGYSTNLTNTKLTFRVKGEMDLQGAHVCLLIQGYHEDICSGWILTGQPINVTKEWSEQVITAVPDEKQWTALGSRHDRTDFYGVVDLKTILCNVNCNIYLILFPVNIVPKGPINGDPHILRAGKDYPVWQTRLPDGYVLVDTIKVEYPS
ncbi:MAG: hypothetical protein A2Y12_09355 [Planctomycetes bacterium GWF2_42_9]|nr:MAG: hypothetical protein A2Y12_09355 [Planctomycetes bacterium GWF2_42_9]